MPPKREEIFLSFTGFLGNTVHEGIIKYWVRSAWHLNILYHRQNRMLTIRSPVAATALLLILGLFTSVDAVPQRRQGNGGNRQQQQQQTAQQQVNRIPQGVSTATDGSAILDATANVK
jgi:hypothetical protein